MKFANQVEILRAFAVAAKQRRDGVTSDDLARLTSVSPATAGLSNNFFMEARLIERVKKGAYLPSKPVQDFATAWGFARTEPERKLAANKLAEPLSRTWFFEAVRERLHMGPASPADLVRALAHVAGAEPHHETQLANLLEWLEFVGLIETNGDRVQMAGEQDTAVAGDEPHVSMQAPHMKSDGGDIATHAEPPASTRQVAMPQQQVEPVVLALGLDIKLTANDLAKLSPDQIRALYEAIGVVASIQATARNQASGQGG
ncbi:hypothetical protein [Rhizocola hellebori]|nr:hypothetical protein [Rhizocola hellebori]